MRTPLSFLALIAFVAVPSAAFADGLSIGDSIPAEASTVKMKSVDESEVSIESVAGEKGTLVIFTCNHCPYVKAWDERIAKIGNDAKAQGIGVIAINANDPVAYPDDGVSCDLLADALPICVDKALPEGWGSAADEEAWRQTLVPLLRALDKAASA